MKPKETSVFSFATGLGVICGQCDEKIEKDHKSISYLNKKIRRDGHDYKKRDIQRTVQLKRDYLQMGPRYQDDT